MLLVRLQKALTSVLVTQAVQAYYEAHTLRGHD